MREEKGGAAMYKLILAEDDYQIRSGLSRFFPWRQIGFELAGSFENGRLALEYARENRVDVVLTDIRMPVMDGLTLAEALKAEHNPALVVVISAYRDFEYARRAVNLGIRHYMVKSTKYDELIDVFKNIRLELDQSLAPPPVSHAPQDEDAGDRIIAKITRYILDNMANASLQTAAAHVSLNPVYLSRYFKEKTGTHFVDYLINVKMKRAAELLQAKDNKIAKISETVGYSNEKNFSRAFKKHYGISPNEYRKLV